MAKAGVKTERCAAEALAAAKRADAAGLPVRRLLPGNQAKKKLSKKRESLLRECIFSKITAKGEGMYADQTP